MQILRLEHRKSHLPAETSLFLARHVYLFFIYVLFIVKMCRHEEMFSADHLFVCSLFSGGDKWDKIKFIENEGVRAQSSAGYFGALPWGGSERVLGGGSTQDLCN